jgi:hypothetical protein
VTAGVRYLARTAARTRAPLAPLAATLLTLIGVYAYRGSEVGPTWGFTALAACGLAAWATGAVLAAEPPAQADMAVAALGGRGARARLDAALVAIVAAGLALVLVAVPVVWQAVTGVDVYDRTPGAGDVVAAALAHLSAALLGGALGVVLGPPRVQRRAVGVAAVAVALLVLVAARALGGPVAVAQALTDARPDTIPPALAWPAASCVALAAVLLAASAAWARRRG